MSDDAGARARLRADRLHRTEQVLAVEHLRTSFHTPDGVVRAVDDVSWTLARGEILGVVGESGCGKSVTALSIMGLVPDPPGRVEGSIRLERPRAGRACPKPRCAASAATPSRWCSRSR